MRRVTILGSVLIVMLLGGLSVAIAAQEGTPPAGTPPAAAGEPEGVTFTPLGFGVSEEVPATPVDFVLARVVIEPGAGWSRGSDSLSVPLFYVESGALTLQIEAPLQVTRAATIEAFATPGAEEEGAVPEPEEVAAGTEVTLEAGDSVVIAPNVAGEIRNDGDEPVVGMAAVVEPLEDSGATPAA